MPVPIAANMSSIFGDTLSIFDELRGKRMLEVRDAFEHIKKTGDIHDYIEALANELPPNLRDKYRRDVEPEKLRNDSLAWSLAFARWFNVFYGPHVEPLVDKSFTVVDRRPKKASSRLYPHRKAGHEHKRKGEEANIVKILYEGLNALNIRHVCNVPDVLYDVEISGPRLISVARQGILMEENWNACTQPFVAIKVRIPGHITVCVYSRKTHRLEFFNSSGSARTERKVKEVVPGMVALVDNLGELPRFIPINRKNIQEEDTYGFCQTWVVWYLYMRFGPGQGFTAKEIAKHIESRSVEELHDEIREFYNLLLENA